jgi:predicted transcriptional regulator
MPTLRVRIESVEEYRERVHADLEAFERGDLGEDRYELSLPDEQALSRLFSPTNIELIRTIAAHEPASMRETAQLVDRDIKEVHRNLQELERLGIIDFEQRGRAKRPTIWYDAIDIEIGLPTSGAPAHDEVSADSHPP